MDIYFDDDDENLDEEIVLNSTEEQKDSGDSEIFEKISLPVMTNYEKSNLLAYRVKQLDNNYKSTLPKNELDSLKNKHGKLLSFFIAEREYQMRLLPNYKIKRFLPNGKYEIWRLEEFEIIPE